MSVGKRLVIVVTSAVKVDIDSQRHPSKKQPLKEVSGIHSLSLDHLCWRHPVKGEWQLIHCVFLFLQIFFLSQNFTQNPSVLKETAIVHPKQQTNQASINEKLSPGHPFEFISSSTKSSSLSSEILFLRNHWHLKVKNLSDQQTKWTRKTRPRPKPWHPFELSDEKVSQSSFYFDFSSYLRLKRTVRL